MKRFPVSFAALAVLVSMVHAGHPERNAEGISEGFTAIFDGKSLVGAETEGNWKIAEDGSLFLEPREGESGWKRYHHYLWLEEKYGDFVFDFEYKHGEGGNSGLYFRVSDKVDPTLHGFEVQIIDSTGKEDDKMGHHDLGGVIRTKGASKNMSRPPGEWNRMTVSMKGSQLTVVLNGETIQDFDLAEAKEEGKDLPAEGYITIQDHGELFWVRNIHVKRL